MLLIVCLFDHSLVISGTEFGYELFLEENKGGIRRDPEIFQGQKEHSLGSFLPYLRNLELLLRQVRLFPTIHFWKGE